MKRVTLAQLAQAYCPICGKRPGAFRHGTKAIFPAHGPKDNPNGCEGSGWIVEDEDLNPPTKENKP